MRKSILFIALTITSLSVSAQKHWRIKPTAEEIEYRKQLPAPSATLMQKTTATFTMPANVRIPGEFEESQAVAIAWIKDLSNTQVDVSSPYATIWAEMADAIQKECQVWIRIEHGSDSNAIKNYMASKGTPLTNYRFFLTVGDDFWARDFGPISFYYGANDDIGILDMNYYPGRDLDNLFPEFLAQQTGYLHVRTNLYAEGGNFITDGFNRSWFSDMVYKANMTSGQPLHGPWTLQQTMDTVKYVWASNEITASAGLQCDGGTEHNDMFMKLMDENTFIIMEYPSVVTASDRTKINNVINALTAAKTIHGKPFRIFRMPMPTQDNGNYLTRCDSINNDARTFVNGTTVNKTYLMPTYSDNTTGNKAGDLAAIAAFKNAAPGYKVVPIDSRLLTVLGGAIHCINMQIPAENPITFWHPPVVDLQPFGSTFHIVAKATNKSGIASTKCIWRVRGSSTWNTINLADSAGYKIGDISWPAQQKDVIEYYLEATSNNGKTAQKPIVASTGGYYTFYFELPAGISNREDNRNFVLNPVPNPSNGSFYVPVSFESERELTGIVTDMMGKKISVINFGKREAGITKLEFDINNAAAGLYFIQIIADGTLIDTKKLMKQ